MSKALNFSKYTTYFACIFAVAGRSQVVWVDRRYPWKRISYNVVFAYYVDDVWSVLAYKWELTFLFVLQSLLVAFERTNDGCMIGKDGHISQIKQIAPLFHGHKNRQKFFSNWLVLLSASDSLRSIIPILNIVQTRTNTYITSIGSCCHVSSVVGKSQSCCIKHWFLNFSKPLCDFRFKQRTDFFGFLLAVL